MQGDFQFFFTSVSLAILHFFFFFLFLLVEKQHALQNSVAHAPCQDTWFQLDIFLCFLVLACLGLLLLPRPLPSPPTPSLLNSPLLSLSHVSSLVSSFSQSLSQYVVLWTTVPWFAFVHSLSRGILTAWHPVSVFKLWHCRTQTHRGCSQKLSQQTKPSSFHNDKEGIEKFSNHLCFTSRHWIFIIL